MPRFHSEEHRANWIASMKKKREDREKGLTKDKPKPTALNGNGSGSIGRAINEIDSAILHLEHKKEAIDVQVHELEATKKALIKAQELVHQ